MLSAAMGPQLSSLLLLSEHSQSPAVLPNINSFVFHFTLIPRFTLLWRGKESLWLQPHFKCTSSEAAAQLPAPGNTPSAEIAAGSKATPFGLLQTHWSSGQEQHALHSLPGCLLTPDPSVLWCEAISCPSGYRDRILCQLLPSLPPAPLPSF